MWVNAIQWKKSRGMNLIIEIYGYNDGFSFQIQIMTWTCVSEYAE